MPNLIDRFVLVLQISGNTFISLFPYVLLGVAVGEILKLTSWTKLIYRGCRKSPFLSTIIAALLGIISPLCTYGTVPVILQLFRAGIPIAPMVTFLSVSSLMNPQLFIITWGGISPEMAMVRAGTVLLFGFLIGLIIHWIPYKLVFNPRISEENSSYENILNSPTKDYNYKKNIRDAWNSLQFVGFYLVVGIILGSLVEVFVPGIWISAILGHESWFSVLLAALLGVPLYACGGGTIPLVRSLIFSGMSMGAALAFFIVGPATRITSLMALAAVLRPLFIIVYIVFLVVYSVIAGILY